MGLTDETLLARLAALMDASLLQWADAAGRGAIRNW